MRRALLPLAFLGLVLAFLPGLASAATDSTYAALRGARPDGRRVPVSGLVLERDAFRFQFDSGAIHFLKPVDGRTVGAVFVGSGSYRLSPATVNERRQLALSSGAGKEFETLTDVHGTLRQEGVSKDFRALVPVYLEFDKNAVVRVGLLPMVGESSVPVDVKLKLPKRPKRALINAHGDILARD